MSKREPQSYTRGPLGSWNVYCPYCKNEMQFPTAPTAIQAGLAHSEVCNV